MNNNNSNRSCDFILDCSIMWTRSCKAWSSERARAMHVSASAEFAEIANDLPRCARFLRSKEFTVAVISWVLKAPLTSVKRWVANPTASTVRGRRTLLSPQQEEQIVELTLKAAHDHTAMRPSAVREAVSTRSIIHLHKSVSNNLLRRHKNWLGFPIDPLARGDSVLRRSTNGC